MWNKLLEWEDGREFFRKLIGLAFLPANEIHNALNYLKMVYQVFLPSFQSFLQYFESYWMNYVKPENWSIFGFLDRTNNSVESNNRRINVEFGIHTRIWQCTGEYTGKKKFTLFKKKILDLRKFLNLYLNKEKFLNFIIFLLDSRQNNFFKLSKFLFQYHE